MRRVLFTITLTLATLVASAQNIAHLDLQKIISQLPDYTQAEIELQEEEKKIMEELEFFNTKVEEKYNEVLKAEQKCQADPANCNKEDLQLKYKAYEDREANFEKIKYDRQVELQNLQTSKMNEIISKIQKVAKVVAEEKGYAYVIDVNSAVVALGDDITDLVLAKLLEGTGSGE